ncbi:ketopantoate reductase family protein, partial [Spirochaetota bacterium]
EKLVIEAQEVANQKNIKLPYDNPFKKVQEVCTLTASNYSSMYQDIKNRGKTEIDFINGAIAEEGKNLNLPCPANNLITDLIHALEIFKNK